MSAQRSAIMIKTAENEGGYAKAYGKSGETYSGIDRLHNPSWAGWPIIDAIKKTRTIRQYEFIKGNPQLDAHVEKAHMDYWVRSKADFITDISLRSFFYDFFFHKPAIAVCFVNDYANAAGIYDTNKGALTSAVLKFMNSNSAIVYQKLWADRLAHYKNGKHPLSYKGDRLVYKTSKGGLINRVNKYPKNLTAPAKFITPKNFWN